MKKVFIILMSLFALMAASTGLKAQEVTILLRPGWNWIGYPYAESVDLENAFVDFEPMNDDVIQSFWGYSEYITDYGWFGGIDELQPGWGYMYYSNRTEEVSVVLSAPASQTMVTTGEPTNITAESAVVGGTVTVPEGAHVFLRGVCWGTEPNPDIDGDHTSEETGVGAFSSTLEGLTPGTAYFVRAYAVTDYGLAYGENLSFVANTSYEYVDLGLPSGTLWATCNVGADVPEGYGDYFAWGETQPKSDYSESTYLYYNDGTLTKYTGSDGLAVLLPEDDAATANWGGDWRMPTKEECQELFYNTTCTWTTRNGVVGQLFTATNGNSLFMPAAGYRDGSELYSENNYGSYWTSSLFTDYPNEAWYYYVDSYSNGKFYYYRWCGYTVRPVRSSEQSSVEINVTSNPTEGGWVSGGGTYQAGDICTLNATANEGYVFVNWLLNGEVVSTEATYSFTVSASMNLVANFGVYSVGDYVDLGLPSGLLWATCNVGAESPEGWGNYYAWGETYPKETYNWNTYQYCNGSILTKYTGNDGLTTLLPEDDAATANWGSEWRMFTYDEWAELFNNTSQTWITQNGVSGVLLTASNGNTLFLPYAGTSNWNSLYDLAGYYWSTSLNMTYPRYAKEAIIDMGAVAYDDMEEGNRFIGLPVRAVRCKNSVINVSANSTVCGLVSGGGTYFDGTDCTVSATANDGYTFIGWSEDGVIISTETTYSFTVCGNRNLVAFFYNYISGACQYVDLGLPSGLLWATCNVGAETPEGYGNYYAWGETQPKTTYSWNTYLYCEGSLSTLTKYCNLSWCGYNGFTDNLTTLLPEDDAATANWGADWRMPTMTEWNELSSNTTSTWATLNGVRGKLYTASNGNGIFLPTAGYRKGNYLYDSGSSGCYWSSSLYDYPYHAREFIIGVVNFFDSYRYFGQSVRAVRVGLQN